MKILNLRLSNLNSLVGEWEIDFTDAAYQTDGIFAIIGPTGAGKTTILDAICLALFGATPRLGKITKSSNDLMSRQSGKCFAEVTFETQSGCYRAHWYQHRSRRKASEPLQPQQHEVAEVKSGKIIEDKVSNVPAVIEKLTGLDFKRFTRSMLLAQGDFAAFLSASESDRSSILEQITGTDIYAELSVATFARYSKEKQKLLDLQRELKAVDLLPDEEVERLKAELARYQKEYQVTHRSYQRALEHSNWRDRYLRLKQQKENMLLELQKWQKKKDAFSSQLAMLEADKSARRLEGKYSELQIRRENLSRLQQELQDSHEELSNVKRKVIFSKASHEQALEELQASKDKISAQQPTIKKARTLESEIKSLLDQEAGALQRHSEQQEKVRQYRQREKKWLDEKTEAEQTQQALTTWLVNYQQDASLQNELGRIESNLDALLEQNEHVASLQKEIENVSQERTEMDNRKLAEQHQADLQEAEKIVAQYLEKLQQQQKDFRLASRVESLEEERQALQENEPCPLCGSLVHPYASDSPSPLAEIEAEYSEAQQRYDQSLAKLQRLRLEQVVSQKDVETGRLRLEDSFNSLKQRLNERKQKCEELNSELEEQLARFQLTVPSVNQLEHVKRTLRDRAHSWQQHKDKHQHLSNVMSNILTRLDALAEQIQEGETALAEAQERLENVEATRRKRQQERRELLDVEDVEEFERKLRDNVTHNEQIYQRAQQKFYETNEAHTGLLNSIKRIQTKLEESVPVVDETERSFRSALKEAGFEGEESYLKALLDERERERLQQEAESIAQEEQHLRFEQEQISQQLEEMKEASFASKDDSDLNAELADYQKQCEDLQQQQGALQNQLDNNAEKKERLAGHIKKLQAQQTETDHWFSLNDLIGSADGKKYRNFVQGLTFEIMIGHANEQLSRMTDRYLLVRDSESQLQLNVIDDYQGGEIRSTRNLSGGESFLVSLALALGLAQMASQKVRVDSLFLDEGFGTLDEDALDLALDALSSLQQHGKVIGVISHVAALKERISNQITVVAGTEGRSRIEGPGVLQVSVTN